MQEQKMKEDAESRMEELWNLFSWPALFVTMWTLFSVHTWSETHLFFVHLKNLFYFLFNFEEIFVNIEDVHLFCWCFILVFLMN